MPESRNPNPSTESLAVSALLAEPGDQESLAKLSLELENFAKSLDSGKTGDLPERLLQMARKIQKLMAGSLENAEESLEQVRKEITEILEVDPGVPGGKGGNGPELSAQKVGFSLPEWVEQEVFEEFLAGSKDLLAEVEAQALALEEKPETALPALKRKIHTLKGEAGLLGLEELEKVCHALEDYLETPVSPARAADLFLEVKDWIEQALEAYENGRLPARDSSEILKDLNPHVPEDPPAENPGTAPDAASTDSIEVEMETSSSSETGGKDNPSPNPAPGAPAQDWDDDSRSLAEEFLEESKEGLAEVDEILLACEGGGVPPERVDALFRVFHTIKGLAGFLELDDITSLAHTTEALLDQARKGEIEIQGAALDLLFDSTEMMRRLLENLRDSLSTGKRPESSPETSELAARIEKVTRDSRRETSSPPAGPTGDNKGSPPPPSGLTVPSSPVGAPATKGVSNNSFKAPPLPPNSPSTEGAIPAQAPRRQNGAEKNPHKLREFVKVDLQRVDNLVALVGELVISQTMVVNSPEIQAVSSTRLQKQLNQLSKITNDLQDIATRMRMVPVRDVFQKMARMVRDLSRKTGKSVRTEIEGEGTEVDRGMVEQLGDPLIHIIRNAVDHGIESPEERARSGKPATGTIFLRARHEGGNVVIEVADDGKGLERKAILAKAMERGLVKEGENLSDQDVFDLIFAPGFSTAKEVTEISGRGVGMDVVKRNIESVRGSVSVSSVPGKGTTIRLILPLTMAIIDGMLVTCGGERYIIPTLSVVESIKPEPGMIYSIAGKREVLSVRGETIPLFRLDRLLDIPGAVQDPSEGLAVIVESHGKKVAILLDDVLTQQQVVIKGLGAGLPSTGHLSGAAILSDGRVGLILNMAEITKLEEVKPNPLGEERNSEERDENNAGDVGLPGSRPEDTPKAGSGADPGPGEDAK